MFLRRISRRRQAATIASLYELRAKAETAAQDAYIKDMIFVANHDARHGRRFVEEVTDTVHRMAPRTRQLAELD